MLPREKTDIVKVGNVIIGGSKDIVLQSMTSCYTHDISSTMKQIRDLSRFGCQLVRVAIFDMKDIDALKVIVEKSPMPVIADIHYTPKLALYSIEAGVKKVRLNPGNIRDKSLIKKILQLAKKRGVPIRIGVNSGSVTDLDIKHYGSMKQAMLGLCDKYLKIFYENDFHDIVLAFKSSDVLLNIDVNTTASKRYSHPLHLGVTESGGEKFGTIKSCVGLSPLLLNGIGNTIRVSLTAEPYKEIIVAKQILKSLGLINGGFTFISCPTCGRMKNDIAPIVKEVEKYLSNNNLDIKVSIMGCSVNGIGESSRSDLGIVVGNESVVLYKNGTVSKTIPYKDALFIIMNELKNFKINKQLIK